MQSSREIGTLQRKRHHRQTQTGGQQAVRCTPRELLAGDITDSYEWVESGRIGEVVTGEWHRRTAVLLVDDRGVRQLNVLGHEELAALLVRDAGPLPTRLSPFELAEAIRGLGVDGRCAVGSPEFWERHKDDLDFFWFPTDDPVLKAELRAKFKAACAAPELIRGEDHQWRLTFFVFNDYGALEQWIVTGNRQRFAANMTLKLPERTFLFPYV